MVKPLISEGRDFLNFSLSKNVMFPQTSHVSAMTNRTFASGSDGEPPIGSIVGNREKLRSLDPHTAQSAKPS